MDAGAAAAGVNAGEGNGGCILGSSRARRRHCRFSVKASRSNGLEKCIYKRLLTSAKERTHHHTHHSYNHHFRSTATATAIATKTNIRVSATIQSDFNLRESSIKTTASKNPNTQTISISKMSSRPTILMVLSSHTAGWYLVNIPIPIIYSRRTN
jgi:hypothetical protein